VLPEPTCGLGDDQVDHLLALTALKVREAATATQDSLYDTAYRSAGQQGHSQQCWTACSRGMACTDYIIQPGVREEGCSHSTQRPAHCIMRHCALCIAVWCRALLLTRFI